MVFWEYWKEHNRGYMFLANLPLSVWCSRRIETWMQEEIYRDETGNRIKNCEFSQNILYFAGQQPISPHGKHSHIRENSSLKDVVNCKKSVCVLQNTVFQLKPQFWQIGIYNRPFACYSFCVFFLREGFHLTWLYRTDEDQSARNRCPCLPPFQFPCAVLANNYFFEYFPCSSTTHYSTKNYSSQLL